MKNVEENITMMQLVHFTPKISKKNYDLAVLN
jgi:hypothetical protein